MYWPAPGHNYITSYFGNRDIPTKGATAYHNALDIAATEGTAIHALYNGTVTNIGFMGSGGHTIIINYDNGYSSTFCHIAPQYLVSKGDRVFIGQTIARVGPTYLDNNSSNYYLNAYGQKTNGATTGCHIHFKLTYNGKVIDPLSIEYQNKS